MHRFASVRQTLVRRDPHWGRLVRFRIYDRYEIDVERHEHRWVAYRRGEGTRRVAREIFIPPDVREDDVATYLDDLLHEQGAPGRSIRRID